MLRVEEAHELHPLIAGRRSVFSFSGRPIEPSRLASVLEAARWSPSNGNSQPWEFVVANRDSAAGFERMLSLLNARNRRWAGSAPVLMLGLARRIDDEGEPLTHAWHDVGIALGLLILQARHLGLEVHPMAGFDSRRARETFAIPDVVEPVTVIALGYAGDPENLPDDLLARERRLRRRKPLARFAWEGEYGERPSN